MHNSGWVSLHGAGIIFLEDGRRWVEFVPGRRSRGDRGRYAPRRPASCSKGPLIQSALPHDAHLLTKTVNFRNWGHLPAACGSEGCSADAGEVAHLAKTSSHIPSNCREYSRFSNTSVAILMELLDSPAEPVCMAAGYSPGKTKPHGSDGCAHRNTLPPACFNISVARLETYIANSFLQGLRWRGNGYSADKEIACFYQTRTFIVVQDIWGFIAVKI